MKNFDPIHGHIRNLALDMLWQDSPDLSSVSLVLLFPSHPASASASFPCLDGLDSTPVTILVFPFPEPYSVCYAQIIHFFKLYKIFQTYDSSVPWPVISRYEVGSEFGMHQLWFCTLLCLWQTVTKFACPVSSGSAS